MKIYNKKKTIFDIIIPLGIVLIVNIIAYLMGGSTCCVLR